MQPAPPGVDLSKVGTHTELDISELADTGNDQNSKDCFRIHKF